MMCQCRFSLGNLQTALIRDVYYRGSFEGAGVENKWEISVSSSLFCCEPKTVL